MSNNDNQNSGNGPKLFDRIIPDQINTAPANTGNSQKKQNNQNNRKKQGGQAANKQKQSQKKKSTGNPAPTNTPKRKSRQTLENSPEKHAKKKKAPAAAAAPAAVNGKNQQKAKGPLLKIIPLGGIGEIGKNMTVYQCGGDSIIVDCGLSFPDDELFGVDIVIPDFSYIDEIVDSLRGVFITHGHEDHIGALPYFLKKYKKVPVYGTKLTLGLIKGKLTEHNMQNSVDLRLIEAGKTTQAGCMSVEAIRVNHSIPDSVAFAIRTPAGVVIQTGDFKIDYTPVFGDTIDLNRFAELGDEGVLALLSDSTNAEKPGQSVTESNVGQALEKLFARAEGKRLIIASFASNIQRVQQIIDLAQRHGRKIAFSGRSMENYTAIALELGYIKVKENVIISIDDLKRYRASDIIIITTGSQGEPMSALSRMASGTHRQIAISSDDVIIISATPIPGNEKSVGKVINELIRLGSDVYYESMYEAHASGHACQDELKLIIKLVKPKFFVPVHGEYKQMKKHANVAELMGIKPANIVLPEIGRTMEFQGGNARLAEQVPSGRVLVDGFGVGDVGSSVLRDRKLLSQDGLMVVVVCLDTDTREIISGPDIISRGFVYVKESEPLMDEAKELVRGILDKWSGAEGKFGRSDLKLRIREDLNKLMYQKTKRSPMILPVIMDV